MGHQTPPTKGSDRGSDSEAAPPPDPDATERGAVPFAWQHGSQLLLLEAGPRGWVMAELRFDPAGCHYVEVRRARYRWAREAAGALLSRALAAGDAIADRTAQDLQRWLAAR